MSSKVSGRLAEPLDPVLQRVLPHIIRINKAHVLMLQARGIRAWDGAFHALAP